MKWLEIQFWQIAKWLIIRGYDRCDVIDYDDMPDHPKNLNAQGRCAQCRAGEVLTWIDEQIELIKM